MLYFYKVWSFKIEKGNSLIVYPTFFSYFCRVKQKLSKNKLPYEQAKTLFRDNDGLDCH